MNGKEAGFLASGGLVLLKLKAVTFSFQNCAKASRCSEVMALMVGESLI
jgi:hypothetical protein